MIQSQADRMDSEPEPGRLLIQVGKCLSNLHTLPGFQEGLQPGALFLVSNRPGIFPRPGQ